jgi:hypothetical protein
MLLIETNIDDMTGEMLAYVQEKLMASGSADAWFTPVQMKKGRPAVMLSVICSEADEEKIARLLLRETSTLGVRVRPVHRWEAEREVLEFQSSLGPAAVKVKRLPGEPPRAAPEFEACRRLAEETGLLLAEVYRIVQAEAQNRLRGVGCSALPVGAGGPRLAGLLLTDVGRGPGPRLSGSCEESNPAPTPARPRGACSNRGWEAART